MSATNTSTFSSALISFAADPNYTKTEGFKQSKALYNQKNTQATHNNSHAPYPIPKVIYNQVKNSGCSEQSFDKLSFQDFLISGSIAAHHRLKHLSLVSGPLCHLVHSLQTVRYSTEDTLYLCLKPRAASCIHCL